MPRKRTEHIVESLDELKRLELQFEGKPEAERVTFLRILKENPGFTHAEAARQLGRSEPTVQRWWRAYKQSGIDGAVELRKSGGRKPARMSDEGVEELTRKVHTEGIRDVRKLQAWIRERFGIEYSRAGVQYLLRTRVGRPEGKPVFYQPEEPVDVPEPVEEQPPVVENPVAPEHYLMPEYIMRFLNALPTTHDVQGWIQSFREVFRSLLGDVDRVSIVVNIDCDLRDPENGRRDLAITQFAANDRAGTSSTIVANKKAGERPSERLFEELKHQQFPVQTYHMPAMFDYMLAGKAYLGTIFLWRERTNPPISVRTLDTVRSLDPFISFLLSDVVARHKYAGAVDHAFNEALGTMVKEAGLTERERQVVVLQLFGHTYDQIAERLFVSIDTVRKYVTSIYRKTGTHSYPELFAKYFTPSLGF